MGAQLQSAAVEPKPAVRLFTAWSVVPEWNGIKDVQFAWFVERREHPAFRYGDLGLGCDPHGLRRQAVDELLTLTEVQELSRYLRATHASQLFAVEKEQPQECLSPFGDEVQTAPTLYYRLSQVEGYSLSVPICGFHMTNGEEQSVYRQVFADHSIEMVRTIGKGLLWCADHAITHEAPLAA